MKLWKDLPLRSNLYDLQVHLLSEATSGHFFWGFTFPHWLGTCIHLGKQVRSLACAIPSIETCRRREVSLKLPEMCFAFVNVSVSIKQLKSKSQHTTWKQYRKSENFIANSYAEFLNKVVRYTNVFYSILVYNLSLIAKVHMAIFKFTECVSSL